MVTFVKKTTKRKVTILIFQTAIKKRFDKKTIIFTLQMQIILLMIKNEVELFSSVVKVMR